MTSLTDLLAGAKCDGTTTNYFYGFKRWREWARKHSLPWLPAKDLHVALYLTSVIQFSNSVSPVVNAFYSIRWAHCLTGDRSPTDTGLVKNVLESGKRKLAKPTVKKEPVTTDLLEKMYKATFEPDNLYNQRIIAMCILCYAGFFRSSEVLNLKRSDIVFHNTYMSIFVEKSKTDVLRDGSHVVISKTGSDLCPVSNLQLYLKLSCITDDSTDFVFRNSTKHGSKYKLRSANKPMTYTRFRELFIQIFTPFVTDIKKFGLHSLRSGGATASANMGTNDRLFKRHGRWRSENAKDGYIKDDLVKRLSVTSNLGL